MKKIRCSKFTDATLSGNHKKIDFDVHVYVQYMLNDDLFKVLLHVLEMITGSEYRFMHLR